MTFKRIITVILLACFTMALLTAKPTYAMTDSPTLSWEDKIDSAIWNTTPDENGRYLVYVSRTGVDADKIEKEFNRRNEFSLSDYQDKATYRRKVGPSVALLAIEKYGMYNSLQLDYGRELFNDELAPIEYELIENYNEFIMNKRTVITDLYGTYNQSFADKFNIASDLVLYEGQYTGSYVLYATRDEIEAMAKDGSITRIVLCEESILFSATDSVSTQIGTDSENGTNSGFFNNGIGYSGTGITIGIIEATEVMTGYDSDETIELYVGYNYQSPQLQSIHNTKLFHINEFGNESDPLIYNNHANLVTSILVGQPSSYSGHTYVGVVHKATAVQVSVANNIELIQRIQLLISDYNVNIINCSAGFYSSGYNTFIDLEIDQIINSTSITFVCASGKYHSDNNTNNTIFSPGYAYNAITVGNLVTKDADCNLISPTNSYSVSNLSSYEESDFSTNKPDIVAPGSNIACKVPNGVYYDSGSSFATPFVTGVVAQMFQADETLMGNPTKTKAILLAGADPTVVATSGNAEAFTGSTLIRDKSGVGMVNAINSVRIAEAGENNSAGTMLYLNTTTTANHTGTLEDGIYLEEYQTIRIVLTFNKPDGQTVPNSGYQYNTALKLYRGTEPEETSSFVYSNVQVIEYTVPKGKAGTYSIKHTVNRFALNGQPLQWRIYAAWRVL